jgi:predicted transposase YbfD/YdcC
VFRVEKDVEIRRRDGSRQYQHEVQFGITSLMRKRADPKRVLKLVRGHGSIENQVHWVRDVTFDEDRSQVRTGNVSQMMAALRNLTISVLRLAGAESIPRAAQHCATYPEVTARLLGLSYAA